MKTAIVWSLLGTAVVAALAAVMPVQAAEHPVPAAVAGAMATVTLADHVKFVPLDSTDTTGHGPKVAVLFGDLKQKGPVAFLALLPAGFSAGPHTHASGSYIVSIKGNYHEFRPGEAHGKPLGAGGHLFWPANSAHNNLCEQAGGPCLNYAYFPNGFDVKK